MQHMQVWQNTRPDHSWIKLYVNIQVDLSGGRLNELEGVMCKESIGSSSAAGARSFLPMLASAAVLSHDQDKMTK